MLKRIWALTHKELIQIRRDRRTLAMMIVLPLLWLVLFGYAFSFDVGEVSVAVIDQSGTKTGALVADAFRNYEKYTPVELADPTEAGVRDALYRGTLQMGVLIPKGYGDKDGAPLRVLVDGADVFAAQTGARLMQKALEPVQEQMRKDLEAQTQAEVKQKLTAELEKRRDALLAQVPAPMRATVEKEIGSALGSPGSLQITPPSPPKLIPELEVLFNPDLKTANMMIPGLLGLVIMFMATMMTALGVVREREYGTMEQLVVTPIRPFELMIGKIAPYFLVAAVDFGLVFLLGSYLFDLTFQGNLPVFLLLSLLLVFTTLGLGIFLSTVAQTQQQAMQMALFVILPQMLLSGLIFPLESLPKVIQYIAYLLPFTHYVPIARGMFIKGQDLSLLWPSAVVLAGYAVVIVTVASLRFRKRIG